MKLYFEPPPKTGNSQLDGWTAKVWQQLNRMDEVLAGSGKTVKLSQLDNYTTIDELNSALASYSTIADTTQQLANYTTNAGFNSAIDAINASLAALTSLVAVKANYVIVTETGDPADPLGQTIYVNTVDKTVKIYEDDTWITLGTWT